MAEPGKESIGLFGLGLIGSAIARRLHAAGHPLRGYDPDASRSAAFRDFGTRCDAGDVWGADIVFSCVFDTGQLAKLIDAAPQGPAVLVSVSTCDPDQMPALAEAASAKAITLIEAPISGTSRALQDGNALFLIGGDPDTAKRLDPIFAAIAHDHRHVGAIGNGNRAKLAINLVLGLNRAALAEGMVFAEALGLAPADFLTIARASAAYSSVMDMKGDLMVRRDFAPQGRIRQSAKDFGLIWSGGAAAGQGMPFAETYLRMMDAAIENGEGDLDNSAVLLPISRARPERE